MPAISSGERLDVEQAVKARYTSAARAREESLRCPVACDPALLAAIPDEVLEQDYGCGDPTRHLRPGETVLDLGSGSGKACFLAGQVVGPTAQVIGVDMNHELPALARRHAAEVARRVGHSNVESRRGRLQDLGLGLDRLDALLAERPVSPSDALAALEHDAGRLRATAPRVASDSVDAVVSSGALNLVEPDAERQLFAELHRVLRRGGRAVISDIVSDEDAPPHLRRHAELCTGCIAGALREDLFLRALEEAGLCGVELLERQDAPWRTVEGIELRSVTVVAFEGKGGPCLDQEHSIVYRGPFRFSCAPGAMRRDPRETKGADYRVTTEAADATCATGGGTGGCC